MSVFKGKERGAMIAKVLLSVTIMRGLRTNVQVFL